MSSKTVLLAVPEEMNSLSEGGSPTDYLRTAGFDVIDAFSYKDALEIIQSRNLSAVVMISDWALKQDEDSSGLMKFLKGKMPTMSLITSTTYRNNDNWMDELFHPRQHEYQHMPAAMEAIVVWLNQVLDNES